MKPPGLPHNEQGRIARLHELAILDSLPEEEFDRITSLAARYFDVPVCLVSLVDEDRQWFKSRYGLDVQATSRDVSFCGHVVEHGKPLVVEDAAKDERFSDNPLVVGSPCIRFYAGVPLVDLDQYALGTLCLIDHQPREFSAEKLAMLKVIAQIVIDAIRLRQRTSELAAAYRLFSEGPVAIIAFRVEGRLTFQHASSNTAELLGLAPERLSAPGFRFEELLFPEDRTEFNACLESLYHGRFNSRELSVRLFPAENNHRSFFMVLRAEYGSDGMASRIHAYLFDTTQQKLLEASLEGAKQRLMLALDAAKLGTWDINLQTGQRLVDERGAAILGLSASEASASFDAWTSRVHPRDQAQMKKALDAHLSGSVEQYISEFRLRHRDGHYVWVESQGRVVGRDTHGAPLRVVGTHLDITGRKHEEQARNRQQKLLALLSASQQQFLLARDTRSALQKLLDPLMSITESRFGMIGEVKRLEGGEIVLDVPALSSRSIESTGSQLFAPRGGDYCGELTLAQLDDNVLGRILRTSSTLIVNEARTLSIEMLAPDIIPPLDSFMAIPCLYNDETLGIIALGNRENGFDQELIQLLQPLAQSLGLLMHARDLEAARQRAENELKTLAATDSLTGIANRRVFLEHCANALAQHRRYGTLFSLALIDIDNFKSINDVYGHPTGDQALKSVTHSVASHLRSSDYFGRVGGEEFGILLPNTVEHDAIALCERLRQIVASNPIRHGHLCFQVHISIGVTQASADSYSIEELMAQADQALYEAKSQGRNRVICFRNTKVASEPAKEGLRST